MSDWLQQFLEATEDNEIDKAAFELRSKKDPADIPGILRALHSPSRARRWGALNALYPSGDRRIVVPLIKVLKNTNEDPWIRGRAAECLIWQGSRMAMKALIECSSDDSPEVRFWCVFALCQCRTRRNKPPLAVIRALEARLDDTGIAAGMWTVGLEALAMLQGKGASPSVRARYKDILERVLQDPLSRPEQWQWAAEYWDTQWSAGYELPPTSLFESAIQKIHAAGFESASFVRESSRFPVPN